MSLAIVILAAGASSRMRGRDKLFESVGGTPILTRLVHFAQGYGAVKGFCTSGGYSHYAEKSIALALVPREHAVEGQEAEIEILGQMRKARVITTPLFDSDGARMRG